MQVTVMKKTMQHIATTLLIFFLLVSITVLSYKFYPLLFADEWKVELLKKVENNYPYRLHAGGCFRFVDQKTICLIPPPFMR